MWAQISNMELKVEDVPPSNSDWDTIIPFALTFRRSNIGFERRADIANHCCCDYWQSQKLPSTITELRACLFFEQRRHHYCGEPPDTHEMIYIRALLEAIRIKIKERLVGFVHVDDIKKELDNQLKIISGLINQSKFHEANVKMIQAEELFEQIQTTDNLNSEIQRNIQMEELTRKIEDVLHHRKV